MCKQYRAVTLKQAHLSVLGSCLMGQVNNEAARVDIYNGVELAMTKHLVKM